MQFFDILKTIYQKNNSLTDKTDMTTSIALNKWLSYDVDNLKVLKNILHYMFYIEPTHYYYLLFFNIGRKLKPPFLNRIKKDKIKYNNLLLRIQEILKWSDREMYLNRKILDKVILTKSSYWKKQLGVK